MGHRYRVPSVALGILVLCIPVMVVPLLARLAQVQPSPLTATQDTYPRSAGQVLRVPAVPVLRLSSIPATAGQNRWQKFIVAPADTTVAYRVTEAFTSLNKVNHVVGVTNALRSEILLDRQHIRNSRIGPITVNIRTLKSGNVLRDDAIRTYWLESSRYPIAEFMPTEIRGLPDTPVEGRDIPLQVTGTLTLHGVVKPTTFAMIVRLQRDTLTGRAKTAIHMTDFGFRPPAVGVLRVSDRVQLELRFTARRTDVPAVRAKINPHQLRMPPATARSAKPDPANGSFRAAVCGAALAGADVPRECWELGSRAGH